MRHTSEWCKHSRQIEDLREQGRTPDQPDIIDTLKAAMVRDDDMLTHVAMAMAECFCSNGVQGSRGMNGAIELALEWYFKKEGGDDNQV